MTRDDNAVYGWALHPTYPTDGAQRMRVAVIRDENVTGLCLQIGDETEIVLDDATAIALSGMLTGGDLAYDIYRTAKALQARNGSALTSASLRQVADEIDERPRWTEAMR